MIISEIFGPTVQGEGPHVGQRCGFVRLGRCLLNCSWCDSRFSWDWDTYDPTVELRELTVDQVVEEVAGMGVRDVVVTGGEPLLQQRELVVLFEAFRAQGWRTHVETAGVLAWEGDPSLVDAWVVSPKLANSGMAADRRLKRHVLRDFAQKQAAFKFVVVEVGDLEEVASIVAVAGTDNVWIMPEGTDAQTVVGRTAALADAVIARGWNLTTRLHVLAWGDERGR